MHTFRYRRSRVPADSLADAKNGQKGRRRLGLNDDMDVVDSAALGMRDVLLDTRTCWCKNISLLTELEASASAACGAEGDSEGRLWFTVVLPELTSYRVGRVMEDIGLIFPADTWYYGCREEHASVSRYGHEMIHHCMTILLACAKPYSSTFIRSGAENLLVSTVTEKLDLSPCPSHRPIGSDTGFASIATWVKHRIDFIQAAGRGDWQGSPERRVFGFSGILWVLKKQFGSVSDALAMEMALAKHYSDEEDGIVDSESAFLM